MMKLLLALCALASANVHAMSDSKTLILGVDGPLLDQSLTKVEEILSSGKQDSLQVYNYFNGLLPSDPNHCALWDAVLGKHDIASGIPIALYHEKVLDCIVRRHENVKVVFVKGSSVGAVSRLHDTIMLPERFGVLGTLIRLGRVIPPTIPFLPLIDIEISTALENAQADQAWWDSWETSVSAAMGTLGPEVAYVLDPSDSNQWQGLEEFLVGTSKGTITLEPATEGSFLARFYGLFAVGVALGLVKALFMFYVVLQVLIRIPPAYRVITICCQVWFTVLLIWVMTTTWIIAHIIHILPGVSQRRMEEGSMLVLHYCYVVFFNLQPWIRIRKAPGMDKYINEMRKQEKGSGGVLFLNHTSFLDPMVMCYLLPWDLVMNTRTLAKEALFQIPIMGKVFTKVGHFPVYFKNDKDFSVDQEKQAEVTARVNEHITTGGTLTFCPEGIVNKDDPTVLKPFRRGSFRIAAEHHLPMWGMVTIGNYRAWPPRAKVGGFPAVIDVDMVTFRSRDEWKRLNKEHGDGEVSTGERLKELQLEACEVSQEKMQELVDEVYRRRHHRGFDWIAEGFTPKKLQKED